MFDWFHNKVPYTDFQQKNLDWLTETVREGEAAVEAKIEEADTAIDNAEAATEAANTAKTGADTAAASANAAATAANNAKDAANTAAANAQAAADKWATPYASTTVAGMTDHAKIYVYTGTEVGYTAGNWYYWNGTAWTSGGVYVGDISDAVLFSTAQSKTDAQKAQARENIDAVSQDDFDQIAKTEQYDDPLFDVYTTPYHEGYMAPNGSVSSTPSFQYTDKIPVQEGWVLTGITTDHQVSCTFRFVTAFLDNTAIPEKGNSSDLGTYTVPSGVNYVVVSQRPVAGKTVSVEISGSEEKTAVNIKQNPMGYMQDSGDLSSGDELHVLENNVKNHVCVSFSGNITSFSKLYIGQRKGSSWEACYIEIDSTNVVFHSDQVDRTVPHGLTIGSDLQIMYEIEESATLSKFILASDGDEFITTLAYRWLSDVGYTAVLSSGSTMTDCVLSWTSKNINDPIWIFGDSYISLYDVRWMYYLLRDGFNNVLINGYAGENSASAMTALKNLLTIHKPGYILWTLGMNDGDSGAVNTSWKTNYDLLINYCKKWNITPILATIPSTPSIDNSYKNAIVRASGYRYIDFALSVDPDGDGTWISGLLGSDNVHPTAKGAIVLYHKAISDFPELMC